MLRGILHSPRRFGWLAGLVLALASLFHPLTMIRVTGATVRLPGGPEIPVTFPYSASVPAGQLQEFAFTVHKGRLTQRGIVFVPDDHFDALVVNGKDVPLDGVDPKDLDNFHHGFRFPIGRYLRAGDNAVVARVRNAGGPGGLDVMSDPHDWMNRAEVIAAMSAFVVLLLTALRTFKVPWSTASLFAAGVAVRFGYLSVTPYSVRDHDVSGHVEYIEYILSHGSLPPPYGGWSFYQPPLYYLLGAGLWKALTILGAESRATILRALQVQSLLYQLGFLGFALGTVSLWVGRLPDALFGRRLASRSALGALFVALLCLWPSGVIHAVRIGNDDLFYLWFGAGFYFASRWWISGRDRDFHVAALCGALGMLTKSNSLLLFVLLAVLLAVRLIKDRERRLVAYLKRAWPMAVLILKSAGVALGRAVVDAVSGRRAHVLVGNMNQAHDNIAVGNRASNYLWFDTKIFVTEPFTNSLDDARGRQFFWNYTLKSSLFGEFSFDHPLLSDAAVVLSILMIVIVACVVVRMVTATREDWLKDLPTFALVPILFAGLAALRMTLPMACSNDFRYILPVLTPALYLYVSGVIVFREHGWTRFATTGAVAGWSFAACSALFFAVLTFA